MWTWVCYPGSSCGDGYYLDLDAGACGICDASCATCFGVGAYRCLTCATSGGVLLSFWPYDDSCNLGCDVGETLDTVSNHCMGACSDYATMI